MPAPIHPKHQPKKPVGQPTRGKTAPNRLRQVDNFILRYDPGLVKRQDGLFNGALFVDLGYGAEALTTLESAQRLRKLNPQLPILGVEIDQERVAAALPFADENTFFRLGGFNVPLINQEKIRIIRAFNVLRQYEEDQVLPAWAQMSGGMLPEGLLIEGTSNPTGAIWAANVLRWSGMDWVQEALVFFSNFHLGFDPVLFQTILPKNYIHHVLPGQPIGDFFEAWKAAAVESRPVGIWGPRQWFAASAAGLRGRGYRVNLHPSWLSRGWLILEQPPV